MSALEGARLADPIGHTNAMAGLFDGKLSVWIRPVSASRPVVNLMWP